MTSPKMMIPDARVSHDPELKVSQNDKPYTVVRVSTSRKDKRTDGWRYLNYRITGFGYVSDKLAGLNKGDRVSIMGDLEEAEGWVDREGKARVTLNVIAEWCSTSLITAAPTDETSQLPEYNDEPPPF